MLTVSPPAFFLQITANPKNRSRLLLCQFFFGFARDWTGILPPAGSFSLACRMAGANPLKISCFFLGNNALFPSKTLEKTQRVCYNIAWSMLPE
jgi:hypothetical protein